MPADLAAALRAAGIGDVDPTLEEVEGWSRLRRIRNNLLAIAAPLL